MVLDAVGSRQVSGILAPSYAAMTGVLIAADFPDRVRSLVIVNGVARTLRAPDYPIGADPEAAAPFMQDAMELDAVERGMDVLRVVAPSVADDDAFRAWWDLAGQPVGLAEHGESHQSSGRRCRCPRGVFHEFQRRLWYCTARWPLHPGSARPLHRRETSVAQDMSNYQARTRCIGSVSPGRCLDEIEEFITGAAWWLRGRTSSPQLFSPISWVRRSGPPHLVTVGGVTCWTTTTALSVTSLHTH